MKLARKFAILVLCCESCNALGSGVNLAILDVPVAAALPDNDDVPVPADVDDVPMYEGDDLTDEAENDDALDDMQVKYKSVDQHVHFVDLPATDNSAFDSDDSDVQIVAGGPSARLMDSMRSRPRQGMPLQFQGSHPSIGNAMNTGVGDANLIKDVVTGDTALSYSEAPVQDSPIDFQDQPRGASIPLPEVEPGFTEAEDEQDDGANSDSYAMMMYFKGRASSVEKENKRMKNMLAQAAAWGKGKKQLVTDLDAEHKETEALKGQLRGFQAAKDRIAKELQAERLREKASESKVRALEYVHQQLVGSQSDNVDLQHQLDNITHTDESLHVQLVASQKGVQAAERSKSAIVEHLKSEQEWLDEEAKKLQNVKIVKQEEDVKLEKAHKTQETVKKFQHVVDQRDELLRKGLQQLLAEKEHEQELRSRMDAQDSQFAVKIRVEQANMTRMRQELKDSASKVKELKRAVALTWRQVAQGNEARQEMDRSMMQSKAELKRVKAVDKEMQARTHTLKQRVEAEEQALQNATGRDQLAEEARDAAQAELASASSTIEKLKQQHASAAQEKRELLNSLALAKREESQLLRDAMSSVSDAGGLNLANLSTPLVQNATSKAVADESSPADLPTLDVVAP